MAKLRPEERWRKHVLERFAAFRQSGQLKKLRTKGLAILGRKKLLTSEEWWKSSHGRMSSQEYREWVEECRKIASRFGLAPWTVELACLLKGYRPEEQLHVMEAQWPQVRVVTEAADPRFLARLAYEAQGLGLHVIHCRGSVETICLFSNLVPIATLEPPPLPLLKPPRDSAFRLRVEVPIGYPPEAASILQKEAGRLAKELLRRLGYSVPQRLRSSPLVAMADKLKVSETLASREAYDVIDDIYGQDLTNDERRRKLVGSRRCKLRKRLVEQYGPDT